MVLVALTIVGALVTVVAGNSKVSRSVVHESRASIPPGWSHAGRHVPDAVLPLRFALTEPKHDMDALLHDIAHPDSPNYGNHWSVADIYDAFRPSAETIDTVHDWLSDFFEPARLRLTPNKGWLEVNATVAEAEDLLRTEYNVYTHDDSGIKHVACHSYSIPEHVRSHVDLVTPTIHFNTMLPRRGGGGAVEAGALSKRAVLPTVSNHSATGKAPARDIGKPGSGIFSGPKNDGVISNFLGQLANCSTQLTLDCIRTLYKVVYVPVAGKKNSYGIVEYSPQAYNPPDLDLFFSKYAPKLNGSRPILASIDGGEMAIGYSPIGFDYNGESNLDLQYAMGLLGTRQNVTLLQVGDPVEGASFNDLLDALDGSYCTYEGGDDPNQDAVYPDPFGGYQGPKACGTVKPPNVISTSYSYNEADLTPFYTQRQCNEYAKLGLMGVTVLYSSGDYGVAGNGGLCLNPDGSQSPDGPLFNPSFPGTCPYITSVGATQIPTNGSVFGAEEACQDVIYSGGGFSNYFAMPSYQKSAVASYYKNHNPGYGSDKYNNSMQVRGFPDLSANGAYYPVAVGGQFYSVFGTSASSPVVGAILTMVNDARIAIGKKPIGFINPAIYSSTFKLAFNDITAKGNPGCGTDGFTAVPGWDPVTGLGTPNFPILLAKFLAMK